MAHIIDSAYKGDFSSFFAFNVYNIMSELT